MEFEIEKNMDRLYTANAKMPVGGLHQGITDVATNVTLIKDEVEIKGEQIKMTGRLSRQDYDKISMTETRKSQFDAMSGIKNMDIISCDIGYHEVGAIIERDQELEENSFELVSGHKGSSPGRLVTTKGQEAQIKELYETQPIAMTIGANESTHFFNF